MIVDVDMGNTRIKWKMRGNAKIHNSSYEAFDYFGQLGGIERICICAVISNDRRKHIAEKITATTKIEPEFVCVQESYGGVTCGYCEPKQMGADRWAAIHGAWHRFGGNTIIIDAGTAITLDYIAGDGSHQGGYIVPGIKMLRESLEQNTANVNPEGVDFGGLSFGQTTSQAVGAGILQMVKGFAENGIKTASCDASLVFTGGDGELLSHLLAKGGSFVPELVFEGIEQLLP